VTGSCLGLTAPASTTAWAEPSKARPRYRKVRTTHSYATPREVRASQGTEGRSPVDAVPGRAGGGPHAGARHCGRFSGGTHAEARRHRRPRLPYPARRAPAKTGGGPTSYIRRHRTVMHLHDCTCVYDCRGLALDTLRLMVRRPASARPLIVRLHVVRPRPRVIACSVSPAWSAAACAANECGSLVPAGSSAPEPAVTSLTRRPQRRVAAVCASSRGF
jgi:hypothetical protein